jgi:hypothetical protein
MKSYGEKQKSRTSMVIVLVIKRLVSSPACLASPQAQACSVFWARAYSQMEIGK